ncbi:ATP-binding protein [Kitasatospora sp. NPDC004240]
MSVTTDAGGPCCGVAVRLIFRADQDPGLARVRDVLRVFLDPLPFGEAERSEVNGAVLEAVLNAVRHGAVREKPAVTIDLAAEAGRVTATVADHGPGFDPEARHRPYGRGVPLMRRLMDEVEFAFPAAGGTRVTLRRTMLRR